MEARSRADLLKAWALEAGFDRAGIARVERSEQGEAFRSWIDRGDHAGMEWIARRVERRLDPRRVLEGARSALCVALRYHPLAGDPVTEDSAAGGATAGRGAPDGDDLWPRVARYARGRDYHDIMGKRLKALARRVEESFPGSGARVYVDTGPVLERELAARAGIGVQGKNTNLLDREMGSWFLLGEILLTLEVAPEDDAREPLTDLCGRCTRCLDHCPTGALPEPFRLDANRCISYWTIEHRGDFPEEVRELVGDWVFGCDVCQEVCPWNVRGDVRGWEDVPDHPELLPPPERRALDLAGLLGLGREEYVERFRGSPMKRAKLGGLKRNAAAAMGNRRDPRYARPLARALERDDDPMVRRQAAWSLGRLGTSEARRALEGALETEADDSVRDAIRRAVSRAPSGPPRPAARGARG